MTRRNVTQLAYQAIRIEGGLIPADELAQLTTLQAPDATEQTESHYYVPRGLKLRDDVARYWKIAQNLWNDHQRLRQRDDVDAHDATVREFLVPLMQDVLGFTDISSDAIVEASGHSYDIGYSALEGRVPLVLAAYDQTLDDATERFGELNSETGRVRRRSPFMLAQETLNASDDALWAIVSNGSTLRILRDNPSLTRPAYIEVDLEALFSEELYADFTAFWLLAHVSRFGKLSTDPADCPWERWRNAGQIAGTRARDRLRDGVALALRALGTGFLAHPANDALRNALQTQDLERGLSKQAFFEELLRLVYRIIFLATIEDRVDATSGSALVFTPGTPIDVRHRYLDGYSLTMLRTRAARRSAHDTHSDLWQALSITFGGLSCGEPALGLPALGGLFDREQCQHVSEALIENRWLLTAIFQLAYFREPTGLTRVNYRDMGPEELGSVYESLLELVPDIQNLSQPSHAKLAFVGDDNASISTKGNTRKLTGSYYTPDSLVQELIKTALEPVIAEALGRFPERPVEALLELTVCDPACGSGHFLLAAARRLADELARLRAQSAAPTQADYRHALRDVVSHCIFGVDKNPMAISLAKTALWLEAYTPDLPLSFLDHHLRCGDALIGVLDQKIMLEGIPDSAYSPQIGDDKVTCRDLKKVNREFRKQVAKEKEMSMVSPRLEFEKVDEAIEFEEFPEKTIDDIHAKTLLFRHRERLSQQASIRIACDLFVAPFLMAKASDSAKFIPTTRELYLQLIGEAPSVEIVEAAQMAARRARVFHWPLEFPAVAQRGGFSVLLGNPPWERLKLKEEEFFAARSQQISQAKTKELRAKSILAISSAEKNSIDGQLYVEFVIAKRDGDASLLFARDSARYPLTGVGDINTYALFSETILSLRAKEGRAGFIVPSGIASDDSTKAYFSALTEREVLHSLYDFENRHGIFPSVHRSYKFCLLTIADAREANFGFFLGDVSELRDTERCFSLSSTDIVGINPNTKTATIFRSRSDSKLTAKIYAANPVLMRREFGEVDESKMTLAWDISLGRLLHMSDDSGSFVAEREKDSLPLYEAKLIHQYDHRWASYRKFDESFSNVSVDDKQNPHCLSIPRFWVPEELINNISRERNWARKWFIAWRKITRATDERTVIATVLPYAAAGDSLLFMFFGEETSAEIAACFLGNLNSLVLDYVARQKIGGINFSFYHLEQLPVIPSNRFDTSAIEFIVPRILELTYTSVDLDEWAKDLGFVGAPFAWNSVRRAQLRAELDAYFAHLYGITRDELRYILDPMEIMGEGYPSETFRVLKSNELKLFDEFRTQRLVLDAWDRLELSGFEGLHYEANGTLIGGVLPQQLSYSEIGVIRNEAEGRFAGLVIYLLECFTELSSVTVHSMVETAILPEYVRSLLDADDRCLFQQLVDDAPGIFLPETTSRLDIILRRLEEAGVVLVRRDDSVLSFRLAAKQAPSDVIQNPGLERLASLVQKLHSNRIARLSKIEVPGIDSSVGKKTA
jgi:hypothetical protein